VGLYLRDVKILERPIPSSPFAWAALAVVTLGSVFLSPYLPGWGNGMLCLLLGMGLGNLWSGPWQKPRNAAVLRWNEKNMLAWATILLGFELHVHFLASIPLMYIPALFLSVLGAVLIGEWLTRRKKGTTMDPTQARLLGAGNAICGNSAIAAVQPLLGAGPAQIAVSVTLINTLGLLGTLFLGPGARFLGLNVTDQAVLMGSLLQSVGHVSAAASGLGEAPALLAMSLKMGRILLLIPLLLWFQSLSSAPLKTNSTAESTDSNLRSLIREIPFYVWGFVLCALATNLLPLPDVFLDVIKSLTQWMLWIALAAIGMNIRVQTVLSQGRDAFVPALGMFVIQILLVLGWLVFLKFLS
jgi:uncharacterized integral membrane protein (TIGR00698 family)